MELFPAASVEQWDLIKRVIQECDYYIVVVAGRYGSVGKDGISYTEREFDYALGSGKPVIGFNHRNPKNLRGSKLEEKDKGKKRLMAFTEKVKQRLCKPWSSAAELGSAVKSAIISELERNPRPGWIRADAVPPSEAVEKLKQRVVDLEEKLKQQKAPTNKRNLPEGDHLLEILVTIAYDYKRAMDRCGIYMRKPKQRIEQTVKMTWDKFILLTGRGLQTGSTCSEIGGVIKSELRDRLESFMAKHLGNPSPEYEYTVSDEKLERILKTLMAKKLVKMQVGHYGSWGDPRWQFTPKGLQHLAELESISGYTVARK